ncbi:MAG: hypothetical protein HEP71_16870 [Roseivirga sp.]|nr:hypothetical protein [Roseivirga sp.]
MKRASLFSLLLFFFCLLSVRGQQLTPETWHTIGRGEVTWANAHVTIKDAFITGPKAGTGSYSFSFEAMAVPESAEAQIWSGFGFSDRENYYTLGLRGGNSQDLYLARYETTGKDKLLALEKVEFKIERNQWVQFRIVLHQGQIEVYLNGNKVPTLIAKDQTLHFSGNVILGGGWTPTSYRNVKIETIPSSYPTAKETTSSILAHELLTSKESKRKSQRALYKTQKVSIKRKGRTEIDMNGNWLFIPEHELESQEQGYAPEQDDQSWHVLNVPDFWNPVRNWLHLQDSNLPHAGSGISDNYREKEESRTTGYTFNSLKTNAAWYRHYIDLPSSIDEKRLLLHFDAVSKVADVYVNGQYAGGHVGMFGEFEVDITDLVKPGKNLIAVNVKVRKFKKASDADENVARAVSVDINNDMLNSLPHGMFAGTEGGIWQPVKLIISNPVRITEQYAATHTRGADFHFKLKNENTISKTVHIGITVRDKETRKILYQDKAGKTLKINPQDTISGSISLGNLNPKTWSPETPHLYTLTTDVFVDGRLEDQQQIDIGFRTFTSQGNKFYLNEKPYWLRGANHPPAGIAPNDAELANTFFKLMQEGNQAITRSHGSPFTETWMKAADEQGVAVSFEGTWPWLMIGDIPSDELLKIWKDEMLNLVRKYRNHPSLFLWTINNEMYFTMFYHNDPPEVRLRKWEILSEVIKEIRKLTPDVPISADSGYSRVEGDYTKNLFPAGIDDGDIDDRHVYFNWYNRDFFQVYDGEWDERIYWSPGANANRPFFSQEASTGYPNNDDGHFTRKYIFKHYVPHAWVGQWAWEDRNPAYGLKRHAFMTKELAELIRRSNPNTAGISLFANLAWYQNVFNAKTVTPYPVHKAVKLAYQPVLISAELFGRHHFAGVSFETDIYLVNNGLSGKELPEGEITWSIQTEGQVLSKGRVNTPEVAFYDRQKVPVTINLPEQLTMPKAYYQLKIKYQSEGTLLSQNQYELTLADKDWPRLESSDKTIGVYDITGDTYQVLDDLKINYTRLNDLTEIRLLDLDLLIVANLDQDNEVPFNWEDVKTMAGNGLNTFLIHPGKHLQWNYGDKIRGIYERKGRVTHMHIPEHPVFEGLEPEDMAWWQQDGRTSPRAARRSFKMKSMENVTKLVSYLRPHVYLGKPTEQLPEMSGVPLLQIDQQKGTIIASEMELNQAGKDPVAARLLVNIIEYLLNK